MTTVIEIYHNAETDLFSVKVKGSDQWDELNDLSESEANDEAEAIAAEINAPIIRN